jgi:aminoglycoside phosphotransferase (APT) family kinase protein
VQPPEWVAEEPVDVERAAALVEAAFPALAGTSVEAFAEGWDNTVVVVDRTWAFRFPRRAISVAGVEREIELLPELAPLLPLPVPVPELVGVPSGAFRWPFFGARLLPGTELADAGLAESDREQVASALGQFLRALHAPEVAARLGSGLRVDPMRRADPSVRARMARERLDRLVGPGTWADDGSVADLFARGETVGDSDAALVLVHGDLHARHVIVDAGGRAAGVIDWGDLCLADPAVDLSIGYGAFSGTSRQAFLDGYGHEVGPDQELRARVLAVSLAAALADYAAEDGRPLLLAESLAALRRAVT